MWASKSKLSCSRCFWAVQVSSLPLSWQIRGFPPWITKAVLIHPRGTCTRRNCSRRNGRYGDGDIEGRYIAMVLHIPTHDSTVFTCAGRMRWIIWSDFQQNRSPPPPRSCSFRRATNRKETSKTQRCGSFPCLSQKVQRTKKVLLVRQAVTVHPGPVTVHPGPSPIFAFEVLVLKFCSTTTHTRTYKQANLAKLAWFFSTKLQAETFAHFAEMKKKLLAHRYCCLVLFGTCSLLRWEMIFSEDLQVRASHHG